MTTTLMNLNLVGWRENVDFRYNDPHNFLSFAMKDRKFAKMIVDLRDSDCVLLMSKSRTRGVLIPGAVAKLSLRDIEKNFMAMRFWCRRLDWWRLNEYAAEKGIHLRGIRAFFKFLAGAKKRKSLELARSVRWSKVKKPMTKAKSKAQLLEMKRRSIAYARSFRWGTPAKAMSKAA